MIEDNDQSAILYLKILWKQEKLTVTKSFLELNERRLFELVLSEGSSNQIAKNLLLILNIGCSSIPQILFDMKSLHIQKLNELFKQLIALDKRFQYQSTSENVVTLAGLVNMLSCHISNEGEILKILNYLDNFGSCDESSGKYIGKLSFEEQQFLRELIFEKLSSFEFNNEKMINFVHENYSKMSSKSFDAIKKVIAKLNTDETMKIFQHSIKILDESARNIAHADDKTAFGSITDRFGIDEVESETDQIIYHLKVVSFLANCGKLPTRANNCESKKPSCESKCSDATCNVNEAGDAKIDIFNDANFFELIGHENSLIRNLVYHLADKYDLKQSEKVRNEMVMLLKE